MIQPVIFEHPSAIASFSPSELEAKIECVLEGRLAGFVIAASMPDAFSQSVEHAKNLGLEGGINTTTMTFNYDTTAADLSAARIENRMPGPEEWEDYGTTSLHADGEAGQEMLSLSKATLGAYTINIFRRGPNRLNDSPIELWDTLQDENMRFLLDHAVDPDNLMPEVTSLAIQAGETVIFNPSNPHMGVTTDAPRRVMTTFFSRNS